MSPDTLIGLLLFALVGGMTPGPNNFMLLASGVNFGFRRTVPHMLGIAGGFCILVMATGAGIGALLALYPPLHVGLKIAGSAYLLYLAWKIARASSMDNGTGDGGAPFSFLQAAAFQWVNPKAWFMAIAAFAIYGDPGNPLGSILIVTLIFLLATFPSVTVWTAFGMALRSFLSDPVRLKWFNIAMGLLLAASLWPMLQ